MARGAIAAAVLVRDVLALARRARGRGAVAMRARLAAVLVRDAHALPRTFAGRTLVAAVSAAAVHAGVRAESNSGE